MTDSPPLHRMGAQACEELLTRWEGLAELRRQRERSVDPGAVSGSEPGDWPEWSPLDLPPECRPLYHPSDLLLLFPHLRLEAGWELDYVFYEEHCGFEVTLYTRRATEGHFSRRSAVPYERGLLPGLEADPTPEGSFERALFLLFARMHFHRADEDQPVFTQGRFLARARRITEFPGEEILPLTGNEEPPAQTDWEARFAHEPEEFFLPTVAALPDGTDEVSMLWYTEWGGIQRRAFRVGPGNSCLPSGTETLVPYDCGMIY